MGRAAISSNCFSCGAILKIAPDGKKAECVNPNCSGGRYFVRCGFCGQFAFAGAQGGLYCWNNTCKMFKRKRRQCAVCGVVARIDFKNQDVCMNRKCPSNEGHIGKCFFCNNQAFLSAPTLRFCTKGDCDFLLTQVSQCGVCNEWSFVDQRKHCENRACKAFSQEVKTCPSCNKVAMIAQLGHPDNGVCMACGVSAKGTASTAIRVGVTDEPIGTATGSIDFGDKQLQELMGAPAQTKTPQPAAGANTPAANPALAPTVNLNSQDLFGAGGAGGTGTPHKGPATPAAAAALRPAGLNEETKIIANPGSQPSSRKTTVMRRPKSALPEGGEIASFGATPGGGGSGNMAQADPNPTSPKGPAGASGNNNPFGAGSPVPTPTPSPFGGPATPAPAFGAPALGGGMGGGGFGATPFGGQPGSGSAPIQPGQPAQPFGAPTPAGGGFGATPFGASPGSGQGAAQPFGSGSPAPSGPFGGPATAQFGQGFQQVAPAMSQQESSSLGQAFEFIKRSILTDHGKEYPIYMVIGLPGSGKTTYLAMLGDILKMKGLKYHFPYPRISTRLVRAMDYVESGGAMGLDQVRMLSRRILDLPTDYSQRFYEKYVEKMYWAAQTQPEVSQGGDEQPSTFFLIADIIRDTATVAKLVTVETSGEDYAAVLDVIQRADLEVDKLTTMQRILLSMMDLSEGFVILFSPEDPLENDRHFQNLFNMINTYIEPRALQVVMNQALKSMAIDPSGKANESGGLGGILASIRQAETLRQQISDRRNTMYRDFNIRLKELNDRLKVSGLSAINAEEGKFLDHIADAIKAISPSLYQKAFQQMEKSGRNPETLLGFYKGMISHALVGENVLRKIVLINIPEPPSLDTAGSPDALAQVAANITEDQWTAIMIQLREKFGLAKNFHVRKPTDFNPKRGFQHMQKLKHISLVVTKSDMFPIIYPPEMYVESKLSRCRNYLRITEDYLKLLGGRVAYYNTSVTGYSILRDTMFYPSKRNTLTPINVVEPIFDMLGITKEE